MLLYKVNSREEAKALFTGDPYAAADIWEKVEEIAFKAAVGDVVGGTTWEIVDGQVRGKARS
jgi:hypothetical protein